MHVDNMVCLYDRFGQWAQDMTGAHSLRELLERYYSSELGEAPFPLRTRQEIVVAAVNEAREGKWVKPIGSSNMIIAVERLVGEQYRHRNLHAEYLENGEAVEVVEFVEGEFEVSEGSSMSSEEVAS